MPSVILPSLASDISEWQGGSAPWPTPLKAKYVNAARILTDESYLQQQLTQESFIKLTSYSQEWYYTELPSERSFSEEIQDTFNAFRFKSVTFCPVITVGFTWTQEQYERKGPTPKAIKRA